MRLTQTNYYLAMLLLFLSSIVLFNLCSEIINQNMCRVDNHTVISH